MKNHIIYFFKGLIVGIGKIMPGVSGALLAISLNIYDKGIDAITNFFSKIKENTLFLLSVGSGIGLSVILFSKLLSNLLTNHFFLTMMLFIGLILGGIIPFIKKNHTKNLSIITALSFFAIIFLESLQIENHLNSNSFINFIVTGVIDAFATVTPGISGTSLLMMYGTYQQLINAIGTINLPVLIPYGIGMAIGIIIFSLIINYLYKKQTKIINNVICGLSSATLIILFTTTITKYNNIIELLLGIILLTIGLYIGNLLKD